MEVTIKTEFKRNLTQIGNSKGVTLPKWLVDQLNLEAGDELTIEVKNIKHKPNKAFVGHSTRNPTFADAMSAFAFEKTPATLV